MIADPVGAGQTKQLRIERLATQETGRILACGGTRGLAGGALAFRDLGERLAKGFDRPDHVFALVEARSAAS
jgi:class 3 adenylate cyclase